MLKLEIKSKNFFQATAAKIKNKKEYKQDIQILKKKYWELMFKVQTKIQFLHELSYLIQKRQEEKLGSKPKVLKANIDVLGSFVNGMGQARQDKDPGEETPTYSQNHIPSKNSFTHILKDKEKEQANLESLIKDFNNMTIRLKVLKDERKAVKLKLRKICIELLRNPDCLYSDNMTPQVLIRQLWEINERIDCKVFSPIYDETSITFFLTISALEEQIAFSSSSDSFFMQYIIQPMSNLSQKLDSMIDFSSNIEYES